ncbi:MAG: hypothetical protein RQ982_07340 [Gammaproteobacteria bacterium]|nr:hypothetical protein [Gammaproteobacteria bacterium]
MQQLILKFEKYLDSLTRRDQIALFITTLVVVIALWSELIYAPLDNDKMLVEQGIVQKAAEIELMQSKMLALKKSTSEDTDAANKERLNRYKEESLRLDKALSKTSSEIINPQEMASLLEQILKSQPGLKFSSLENKPAIPEFIETRDEMKVAAENVNTIYRHSVVLQMEGDYHDTLAYLKKLEQFPWRFFWSSVEIEASGYPNALITLEVYTLGFREGLIGV